MPWTSTTPEPYPPLGADTSRTGFDRRQSMMLLWCAAASLGLLFLKFNGPAVSLSMVRSGMTLTDTSDVVTYLPLLAPVIGLLAWHFNPGRVAPWLLLAGVVCAAPLAILSMTTGSYDTALLTLVMVLGAGAPSFTLIGVLAAATVIWRQGLHAAGVSLIGTAVAVQFVGPVVIAGAAGQSALWGLAGAETIRILTVVFLVLAAAGAITGVVQSLRLSPSVTGTPGWPATVAGSLAVVGQVLVIVWPPNLDRVRDGGIADYYLYFGLTFLAIGVLVSAIGGTRVLLSAAGVGVLVGVFGVLVAPSIEVVSEMPVLALCVGIGSLLVGAAVAFSPNRARIGVSALGVVAVGLLALFLVTNTDRPYASYRTVLLVVTPILLVIGIIAAVSAVAAIGHVLADRLQGPAVLAGMATAFSTGAAALCGYFGSQLTRQRASIDALLPSSAAGIFIAAALIAVVTLTGIARTRGERTPGGGTLESPTAGPTRYGAAEGVATRE